MATMTAIPASLDFEIARAFEDVRAVIGERAERSGAGHEAGGRGWSWVRCFEWPYVRAKDRNGRGKHWSSSRKPRAKQSGEPCRDVFAFGAVADRGGKRDGTWSSGEGPVLSDVIAKRKCLIERYGCKCLLRCS